MNSDFRNISASLQAMESECIKLRATIKQLVSALEFYADQNNWMVTRKDDLHEARMTIISDARSYGWQRTRGLASELLLIGGRKADEALKVYKVENEDAQ